MLLLLLVMSLFITIKFLFTRQIITPMDITIHSYLKVPNIIIGIGVKPWSKSNIEIKK